MIKINASPQRREKFHAAQLSRRKPLNLIQDVCTRWNSTLHMIRRARKLRSAIKTFIQRHPEEQLIDLSATEWKHIDYLIEILYPFSKFTKAIGKSVNSPTIHQVLSAYNHLFNHLDDQVDQLRGKRLPWKVKIRSALKKAHKKLQEYYTKTRDDIGELYGVATLLSPEYGKLSFFETEEWKEDKKPFKWVSVTCYNACYFD